MNHFRDRCDMNLCEKEKTPSKRCMNQVNHEQQRRLTSLQFVSCHCMAERLSERDRGGERHVFTIECEGKMNLRASEETEEKKDCFKCSLVHSFIFDITE